MHTEALDLRELVIFLVTAGLVVPIVERLRISPTLGFLAMGVIIGPFGLGQFVEQYPWLGNFVFSDIDGVKALAELGVVFLLFMIGLDLSFERLWSMRRLVFGLGVAQIAVTAIVITAAAMAYGNPTATSVVIGLALALSSTAIVMQLLTEGRRLGTTVGRTSFAILLAQDLAVVPILFLVGMLGAQSDLSAGHSLVQALGVAALAIGIIMIVGRVVVRPFFNFISASRKPELFVAAVLLIIIATSVITAKAGLSLALGAFLAGLLLAETEYRHEIEADIRPFKGLLLGLFFLSVGMGLDLAAVAEAPAWIAASVLGLFAIKTTVTAGLAWLFGLKPGEAVETGLLLGQGGEFAFVIVGMAAALGIAPPDVALFMLLVAGITMALTPLLPKLARTAHQMIDNRWSPAPPDLMTDIPQDVEDHVIIAGYGRVGHMLGAMLDEQRIPHVGLDTDAARVSEFREQDAAVYFGDASRTSILNLARVDQAQALVVTLNDAQQTARIVSAIRKDSPDLQIFARARDVTHARELLSAGATAVIPETTEASLQLGEALLAGVGIPVEAAHKIVEERRFLEQAHLLEGATADDV